MTYAVRDGIISHCGEMNQKYIQKRKEYIDLNAYQYAGEYNPFTYEGCVVKMADKIAYLARDIEDALRLHVLKQSQIDELRDQLNQMGTYQFYAINNGSVVNYFIHDVVENSSVEKGIGLSQEAFDKMKVIMKFNYQNIYLIKRVQIHEKYVSLILNSLFDFLYDYKQYDDFIQKLKHDLNQYPKLIGHYLTWLEKYAYIKQYPRKEQYKNQIVYDFEKDFQAFEKSIIDYLAGMSDAFIIQVFNELISF